MTRTALTSVMAGALIGVSAFATPTSAASADKLNISIEMYGGATFFAGLEGNANDDIDTAGLLGGAASINMPFSGNWFAQVDMSAAGAFNNGVEDGQFLSSIAGALHVGCRDGDNMWGFFGGGGQATTQDDDAEDLWFLGLEGQLAFREFLLYGQGGYLDSNVRFGSEDAFHNAWFLRAVGRFNLSPDTMLQGELAYADGEQDSDDQDMTVWGWGARIEHRLGSVQNTSIFVAYDGARYENDDNGDDGRFVEHTVRIGVSVRFGGDAMTAIDTPNFGRWTTAGEFLD